MSRLFYLFFITAMIAPFVSMMFRISRMGDPTKSILARLMLRRNFQFYNGPVELRYIARAWMVGFLALWVLLVIVILFGEEV